MQPTTTGWSVSGPVGRVGSNSAVFAALSDIKTSGESSDEAPVEPTADKASRMAKLELRKEEKTRN